MSLDTFVIIAEQYQKEADALADYEAVRKIYADQGIIDTYDAAVLTRKPDGKVHIVKRTDMPAQKGARRGLATGLAVGVVAALVPGVGLAAGALGGATLGTGLGAVAGHVSSGMKRSDLKELGELLDSGTSGLIVVAASDIEAKVHAAITRARKHGKASLQADAEKLLESLEA